MRKHGRQLPYHPLQVVAVAVFLALGFAFYVFFVPFVEKKLFEYVVMGIYTPLFDVVPPEFGTSVNPTDEVSKAAAEARRRSKVLQPIVRQEMPPGHDTDNSYGSGSGRIVPRPDNHRRPNKRGRFLVDFPLEPLAKISARSTESDGSDRAPETSSSLAPLQLEARPNQPVSSTRIIASSPDSSIDSSDLHPFRISSSEAEEVQGLTSIPIPGIVAQKGIQLSRSTSDEYEASGVEDSERIPSRIVRRSSNWANLVLNSGRGEHPLQACNLLLDR